MVGLEVEVEAAEAAAGKKFVKSDKITLILYHNLIKIILLVAPVAQLDRATDS